MPAKILLIKEGDKFKLRSQAEARKESSEGNTSNSQKSEASTSPAKNKTLRDEKAPNPLISRYVPSSKRKRGESPFTKCSKVANNNHIIIKEVGDSKETKQKTYVFDRIKPSTT